MPRIECPNCGTPDKVDERDLGREVECVRCRTAYFAAYVPPPRNDRPARADGSNFAGWALVLGVTSVLTSVICGAGVVFGLGGLLAGFGGLQSRRRGASIAGLLLSLSGVILSLGAVIFFVSVMSAVGRNVPPKPDGTQPPFSRNIN